MTYTIGIIGGTGKEGKGLAYRWAKAGHKIIIGSRMEEKAHNAVEEILELLHGEGNLIGKINKDAVLESDFAVLTVPFSAHATTLQDLKEELQGKILIDVVVPLNPPKVSRVSMPPEGSAAQQAQLILGSETQVVAAFHNISFERLLSDEEPECDILVSGGNNESRNVVLGLVKDAGLVGWDAGSIENSMVAEGLTSVLIGLNLQNKVHSAGIKITGIPR